MYFLGQNTIGATHYVCRDSITPFFVILSIYSFSNLRAFCNSLQGSYSIVRASGGWSSIRCFTALVFLRWPSHIYSNLYIIRVFCALSASNIAKIVTFVRQSSFCSSAPSTCTSACRRICSQRISAVVQCTEPNLSVATSAIVSSSLSRCTTWSGASIVNSTTIFFGRWMVILPKLLFNIRNCCSGVISQIPVAGNQIRLLDMLGWGSTKKIPASDDFTETLSFVRRWILFPCYMRTLCRLCLSSSSNSSCRSPRRSLLFIWSPLLRVSPQGSSGTGQPCSIVV